MISVKNKKILNSLINKKEGELAKVEDTNSYYLFKDGKWIETSLSSFSVKTYDIYKQKYDKEDPLDDYKLTCGEKVIEQYVKETNAEYYMLLNHEMRYFTLFQTGCSGDNTPIHKEVMALLDYFDNVKAITREDNGIEIWATFNGQLGMFLLFDYDKGVIKCS